MKSWLAPNHNVRMSKFKVSTKESIIILYDNLSFQNKICLRNVQDFSTNNTKILSSISCIDFSLHMIITKTKLPAPSVFNQNDYIGSINGLFSTKQSQQSQKPQNPMRVAGGRQSIRVITVADCTMGICNKYYRHNGLKTTSMQTSTPGTNYTKLLPHTTRCLQSAPFNWHN